jgi:alkylated DNA repair dioxygenase AlkB
MEQSELFAQPSTGLIDGLRHADEFLPSAAEVDLLARFATLPFHEAEYRQYRARRRIVSYGASYDFEKYELRPAPPIPAFLDPVRERIAAWAGQDPADFTHAVVTEYRPGTPLGWHRDIPHFETVVGLSLGGVARMRLRPYRPGQPADPERTLSLKLLPRSIYALERVARWDWQHCIAPTRELRYSITFRTLRRPDARLEARRTAHGPGVAEIAAVGYPAARQPSIPSGNQYVRR